MPEVFGKNLTQEEVDGMTVEMLILELQNALRELERRGVNPEHIASNMYNAVSTRTILQIVSKLDAEVRSLGYTGN